MATELNLVDDVRKAILKSGLTRLGVAKAAGLPYSVVHHFIDGKRGLSLESAAAICGALGFKLTPVRKRK